ncbi:hypothetical protein FJY93_04335 [Candidatus Kaiserbacteria bacterium]|nr:hypothetical protein [Candidatus Kaiserbacteria bacterium]
MRVEPHGIDSILHIVKRGARGMDITRDDVDRQYFLNSLFYLNDEHQDVNWKNTIAHHQPLTHPAHWPEQKPLVEILAYTLMSNHIHLIIREIQDGGIAKFTQRLFGSMSARFNAKYSETGSLFQGGYKGRVVHDDDDLRWLASYVMVKNVFELYPDGIYKAMRDFDMVWDWALEYPYSSLPVYGAHTTSSIVAPDNILFSTTGTPKKFKRDAQDMMYAFMEKRSNDRTWLMLEN